MAKDKDYIKLINTNRWRQLRKQVLSLHPLCQCCEEEGRVTAATEVHHIRPVEEAVGYDDKHSRMYDAGNLRALCHECHVKIHTAMGRCGKEATRQRNEKQVRAVIDRFFGSTDD